MLKTQYKELSLLSNLVCCPALPPSTPGGRAEGREESAAAEKLPCTPLMLVPVLPAHKEASDHQFSVSMHMYTERGTPYMYHILCRVSQAFETQNSAKFRRLAYTMNSQRIWTVGQSRSVGGVMAESIVLCGISSSQSSDCYQQNSRRGVAIIWQVSS